MANRDFSGLGRRRNVDLSNIGGAQPTPPSRPPYNFWKIGTIFVLVIMLCGVISGGLYFIFRPSGTTQPTQVAGNQQQQSQPVAQQPGQAPYFPGQKPSQQPTGERPTLNVCVYPFGTYLGPLQTAVTDDPNRPYILNVIPVNFHDPNNPDNVIVDGTEEAQVKYMTVGQDGIECDVLPNTSDVLARHPEIGKWFSDIDSSIGGDKTRVRYVGVAGCPDKKIEKINDLVGCTIALSPGSVGQLQILSILKPLRINPTDITWLTGETGPDGKFHEFTVDEACQAFKDGKADALPAWIPCVDDVDPTNSYSKIFVDSTWLRNITDIWIVSNKANDDPVKSEAVFWFLVDQYRALKIQQENLKLAGEQIASWQFTWKGKTYSTNDWSYIYPNTTDKPNKAENDMHAWLDQYGQAGLDPNLLLLQQPDVLPQRFLTERDILAYGGIQMSGLTDSNSLVEYKYLKRLAEYVATHPELRPRIGSTFPNTGYLPFQVIPANPQDAKALVDIPPVLELKSCTDQLNYKAGEDFLRPGTPDYNNFVACSKDLPQFMSQTQGATIVITASAAGWCKYTTQYVHDFAIRRAENLQFALVSGAGIPATLITVDAKVGTFSCDPAVNQKDRWAMIAVVPNSTGQQ